MSSTTTSTSPFAPLVFTGVSQYSSDFQQIVDRAVAIASLPGKALQNQQTDIVQEKLLASGLASAVSSLSSSVAALGKLGANHALTATSSDTTKVTATATDSATAGYYSITNIKSIARAAAETSLAPYAATDAVSADGNFSLTVGTHAAYPISLGAAGSPGNKNSLTGLRDAINALGAGVTASILTTSGGNYLSVTANSAGATTLTLTDSSNANFLSQTNQGANTEFTLNGAPVSKPSTMINDVVPGLVLNVTGTTSGTDSVNISLAPDSSKLASALTALVNSYNTVAGQVNAQIGPSGGLLSGNSIIHQVRGAMLDLVNYSGGSGSIHSLTDLGIELDSTGKMSFNSDQLNSLTAAQIADASSFLGSATSGMGKVATEFSQISDPATGTIKAQLDSFDAANARISAQVNTLSSRIADMQAGLQRRLQAADTLLASLASQQSVLTASIQSLNYTSFGASTTSSNPNLG